MMLTLTELACELRKIFRFSWLTYDRRGDDWHVISLWQNRPVYEWGMWVPWRDDPPGTYIDREFLRPDISFDLFEFVSDKTGLIDFSKCIVEVAE